MQNSQIKGLVSREILGQNIFRANLRLVSNRLRDNPWIEMAEVGRKIPDRIQIKIKERTPFAKVEIAGGKAFLIDKKAFLIKKIENQEYQVLPTIKLVNDTDYRIGSSLKTEEVKSGIKFIQNIFSLKNSDHAINFNSISMEEGGCFILETPTVNIRFSQIKLKENLNKLRIASRIIQKEALKVKFIDLAFDDQIVLKLL